MRASAASPGSLAKICGEPHPAWFLLWLPLTMVAVDDSPELAGAMARLLAVLLIAALTWATGRGAAGRRAEGGFSALFLVGWFAAAGTIFRLDGPASSIVARLAVSGGLLLGPALLIWAWHRRSQMTPATDARFEATHGSAAGLLAYAAVAALALTVLDRLIGLHAADLLVVGTGVCLYVLFRVQGRIQQMGGLG